MFILNPSVFNNKNKKKKISLSWWKSKFVLTRSLKKNKIIKIKKLSDDLFLIKILNNLLDV